tara:strand:- start:1611 stop:1946 length:336 start_codon:yes stop_codon:yes gene_type:complete
VDELSIKIHFTDRQGEYHLVDVPIDISMNLMEVIRSYELVEEGMIGICGGMAMCASCHCYITSNHQLKSPSSEERFMLLDANDVRENSRLSCQIPISLELNNLELIISPFQ